MDLCRGGYQGFKSGREEMVLGDNCDREGQLKVFPASLGRLSLGKVSRWMDMQGETIIYGELVCVGGLEK